MTVRSSKHQGTLGTFAGVFTPSVLTILGIILFLRLGFVVGNAGLGQALLIIGIATAVSILTSISLAAIATNITVRGGGDYYLISRTLGVEFGGSIGIVLFLAQSVSVAFYAIGFGEVTASVLGWDSTLAVQGVALVAIVALFGFSWAGADLATKFQYVVMAALGAALLAFYVGALTSTDGEILSTSWSPPLEALGFWAVFAIFFPAVTGFTQGVSMSGDLIDPAKSLPNGTFAAVGLSTVVYTTVAVILAASIPIETLMTDGGEAMREVAVIGALVLIGVFAATLSSAMASFLGAPRILQSLASDRIFPVLNPFARGHGPANNPRRAVLLSLGIAVFTLALGALNAIAELVSMFFLISYGMINYATYWEARANSPSFRPTFRYFDKRLSLLGAVACLGAMLAINVIAGGAALLVLFLLHQYLTHRPTPERWADALRSHQFQRAKEGIRALSAEEKHDRNWRPMILAFSADSERRERLLRFASWLEGGSGMTAAFNIIQGEGALARRERDIEHDHLRRQVEALELEVYPRVVLTPDGMDSLPVIVQAFGLGGLEANTALFGWPEDVTEEVAATYASTLQDVARLGISVVSMSSDLQRWEALLHRDPRTHRIDVWWSDDDSGRLALLAAYLFTRRDEWSSAHIRVLAFAEPSETAATEAGLEEMLEEARIPAQVVIVAEPRPEAIVENSVDASLVLLPMRIRKTEIYHSIGGDMASLLKKLPLTAGILAGHTVDLLAGPESGKHVTLAEAEEAVDEAKARLHTLEKRLSAIDKELESVEGRRADGDETDEHLEELARQRDTALRRVLKASVRVQSAEAEVEALLSDRS